jgi:lipopolysaccharide transport system ATP-binding protein
MTVAIRADSVSKAFYVRPNRPRTLREFAINRMRGHREPVKEIWALRDVSFELQEGQALGIIGHNGAGKSTLLRLLCDIGRPTSGSIYRHGPVSGLLELGTTFHPLMSGRENIRTAAMLNGLSRRQVQKLEQEMIEFAELEENIDQPVRTYSTGMCLRLAFAAAIHFHPEILVIDEILVVGDIRFQQKCEEKLSEFRREGKTLILTAHDMEKIEKFCDEVLVLEEGQLLVHADPRTAVESYKGLMRERTERRIAELPKSSAEVVSQMEKGFRTGTQEVSIRALKFYDSTGSIVQRVASGDGLTIDMEIEVLNGTKDFAITVGIFGEKELKCFETSIGSVRDMLGYRNGQNKIRCRIATLPLLAGQYYANVGVYPTSWEFTYDYHREMHAFQIEGGSDNASGVVRLSPVWSLL